MGFTRHIALNLCLWGDYHGGNPQLLVHYILLKSRNYHASMSKLKKINFLCVRKLNYQFYKEKISRLNYLGLKLNLAKLLSESVQYEYTF